MRLGPGGGADATVIAAEKLVHLPSRVTIGGKGRAPFHMCPGAICWPCQCERLGNLSCLLSFPQNRAVLRRSAMSS